MRVIFEDLSLRVDSIVMLHPLVLSFSPEACQKQVFGAYLGGNKIKDLPRLLKDIQKKARFHLEMTSSRCVGGSKARFCSSPEAGVVRLESLEPRPTNQTVRSFCTALSSS